MSDTWMMVLLSLVVFVAVLYALADGTPSRVCSAKDSAEGLPKKYPDIA